MPGVNVASWAEVSEIQPRLSTVGFLFSRGRKGLRLTIEPRTNRASQHWALQPVDY